MVLLLRFREVPVRHLTRMWEIQPEEYFRFRHSLSANPPTSYVSHCFLLISLGLQLFCLWRDRPNSGLRHYVGELSRLTHN
jgi:hypothetical protein